MIISNGEWLMSYELLVVMGDKGSPPWEINSQSLEDTQVGYISQQNTLDKHTLEKNT